jgi:hypothetical protein
LTDSEIKRNRSEVSSKWNKCRIYVGDQLERCRCALSLISFLHSHFPFAGLLKFVFVYLANTAVLCYSLTLICCYQVQNYIYWLISTENDHNQFIFNARIKTVHGLMKTL